MKTAQIALSNVSKTFARVEGRKREGTAALQRISIAVESGEFVCVVGPSGCGKTTLLNMIAGLDHPDTGHVNLDGRPVLGPGPDRAVVFQESGLFPWMSVRKNVEYGLKLKGMRKEERRALAMDHLRRVHLARWADSLPHELSGGMRQRVSIARALALEPKVLLMDEPFSALDAQTRELLHDEVQRIWLETRTTVFFVTHNLSEAVYLGTQVLIMTAGPGRIKKALRVPLGFPRSRGSTDFVQFAAHLHHQIREEVDKVAASELDDAWRSDATPAESAEPDEGTGI